MERKKLRWAKMGKVETQMASSLQRLGKGQDFTFLFFPSFYIPAGAGGSKFYVLCFFS